MALGLIAAIALYHLLRVDVPNPLVRFAYCCFFWGGVAVANLQLILVFETDGPTIGWSIFSTVLFIGLLSFFALVASAKFLMQEKLLLLIVFLTVVLAILQFSSVDQQLLNTYARIYAAVCILSVPALIIRSFLTSP